jgi:hypothetical protein
MKHRILAACLALAVVAIAPAAQAQSADAVIANVPSNAPPPVPAGLKVTCIVDPNSLQSAKSCPVVKYKGLTTWAFSYIDNRVSLALVTYDGSGKVVRNVEQTGLRYVWNITSGAQSQTIDIFGQSNAHVQLPWANFGP